MFETQFRSASVVPGRGAYRRTQLAWAFVLAAALVLVIALFG
jgi:hypothetical protein